MRIEIAFRVNHAVDEVRVNAVQVAGRGDDIVQAGFGRSQELWSEFSFWSGLAPVFFEMVDVGGCDVGVIFAVGG